MRRGIQRRENQAPGGGGGGGNDAETEEAISEDVTRKTFRRQIPHPDGPGSPTPDGYETAEVGRTYDQITVSIDNSKAPGPSGKLKEKIGVPEFPSHGNLKQYEVFIGRKMHPASGYDDKEEMIFVSIAFLPGITLEDLTWEPPRMRKISAMLAYEVEDTCPVWLARKIIRINALLSQYGMELNGRQVLWLVKHSLDFNDNLSNSVSIVEFTQLKYMGDDKIERFVETWNWFLERIQHGVMTELGLRDQLWNTIKDSKKM